MKMRKKLIIIFLFIILSISFNKITNAYTNICWKCSTTISSEFCEKCSECDWYICVSCGACIAPKYGSCNRYQKIIDNYARWNLISNILIIVLIIFVFVIKHLIDYFSKDNIEKRNLIKKLNEYNLPASYSHSENIKILKLYNELKTRNLKYNTKESINYNENILDSAIKNEIHKKNIQRIKNGEYKINDILYTKDGKKAEIIEVSNNKILLNIYEKEIVEWRMSNKKEEKIKIIKQIYDKKDINKYFSIK